MTQNMPLWRLVAITYGDNFADCFVDHMEYNSPYEVRLKNSHIYLTRISKNKIRISPTEKTQNME